MELGTPEYRLYLYNESGTLIGPAMPICAGNDTLAIAESEKRIGRLAAVLQDGLRVVKKFGCGSARGAGGQGAAEKMARSISELTRD
jgi:hypothetical protein